MEARFHTLGFFASFSPRKGENAGLWLQVAEHERKAQISALFGIVQIDLRDFLYAAHAVLQRVSVQVEYVCAALRVAVVLQVHFQRVQEVGLVHLVVAGKLCYCGMDQAVDLNGRYDLRDQERERVVFGFGDSGAAHRVEAVDEQLVLQGDCAERCKGQGNRYRDFARHPLLLDGLNETGCLFVCKEHDDGIFELGFGEANVHALAEVDDVL